MAGSTPVINIAFHRSKLSEYPGYSEAHDVYRDLVQSLLLLLSSPNGSVSSSTAAALDIVNFSRIPVLLKGGGYRSPSFLPFYFRENVCFQRMFVTY